MSAYEFFPFNPEHNWPKFLPPHVLGFTVKGLGAVYRHISDGSDAFVPFSS
jgi:hypothetical protein